MQMRGDLLARDPNEAMTRDLVRLAPLSNRSRRLVLPAFYRDEKSANTHKHARGEVLVHNIRENAGEELYEARVSREGARIGRQNGLIMPTNIAAKAFPSVGRHQSPVPFKMTMMIAESAKHKKGLANDDHSFISFTMSDTTPVLPMVLLVAGSRETTRAFMHTHLCEALDQWVAKHGKPSLVIHGGARGIDKMADAWATAAGYTIQVYVPEWKTDKGTVDRGAGLARNTDMVQAATHVVCFWNGKSADTADTIRKTRELGKPLDIYEC
jgi:hypothetical protein